MNGVDVKAALSPREREIAISAIGDRVSGSPVEAAKQLLAGIAVLDGDRLPVLVWPEAATLRERANWLSDQAKDYLERADLFDARMVAISPSGLQVLEEQRGCVQASNESALTPRLSASFASAHPEEETDSRLQSCSQIDQGSSGAC
jgi:hypothetical protein